MGEAAAGGEESARRGNATAIWLRRKKKVRGFGMNNLFGGKRAKAGLPAFRKLSATLKTSQKKSKSRFVYV